MKFIKKRNKSEHQPKSQLPLRLNILFVIVFILFAMLIGQLANLQIINGPKFEAEATNNDVLTSRKNVPRGMIYDATGKLLAANNSSRAITYTKPLIVSHKEMYQLANNLVKYIKVDTTNISQSNKVDYYLAQPGKEEKVNKHIKQAATLDGSVLYAKQFDYITKHKLYKKFTTAQKEAAVIYGRMNAAYSLSTVYLKTSDVSDDEMAEVGGHLASLPGVKIGTSWSRSYPEGEAIKSVIGTVTSEKQGLPSTHVNSLLAQGYSRNDSVGSSYIESEYEDALKGTKEIVNLETKNGQITKEIKKYGGQPGDNIVLTINAKFQTKVQSIIESALKNSGNPYAPGAYAIVMNPNNGAILALAGVSRDIKTGKVTENAIGTINRAFVMGSVVKPAMIMGGFHSGVITPRHNTLVDKPIKIAGTPPKGSWFNHHGNNDMPLTASDALMVSSNSYMMQLAMKEAHFHYRPGKDLTMNPDIFNKLRSNFNQFGLGVKTGVDIPGEGTGFEGPGGTANIGKALDLSFGNYDSYTPIQLAQYISVLANGGYRLQPHIVQSIRGTNANGSLGPIKHVFEPNILNVVPGTTAEWNIIKNGLYKVVHSSSRYRTGSTMASVKPLLVGKTGTAQTFYKNNNTFTLSAITYAPQKNPQVAVAVVFPGVSHERPIHMQSTNAIYQAYWSMVQSSEGLE
ncbi:peptidoglycan D,D-transpeptidase FtsI family protein [Ligilactobacillus ceti]|uniref:Penicillin-binding protein n=1 Tax=Ligilactobacillus ceti DSM 22408 TaxID=1122146 RepID=A0A0R2KQ99_9LACO|nr:penicillin-binding protein 2 [Ligilactobacillus ceti]KRN88567.1 penicillin-binding protein [Ligilactobacillus ceti DSM 22408]